MPAPGAHSGGPDEARGLQEAAADFSSAAARFLRALTGLFGLELRESGFHTLVLGLLAVALILACAFAYLFLLLGMALVLSGLLGGGWVPTLFLLALFHALLAGGLFLALRNLAQRPLFPGTREAVRRELGRFS